MSVDSRSARGALALVLGLALVGSAAPARADAAPARRFTGAFSGTGRACYGRLYVRTRTISWLTPFSQCQQVPYRIVDQHEDGNARAITFALVRRPKGCRYGVIHLRHGDGPDAAIGWEVFGYASLDDYRADRDRGFEADLDTAMSCYLVAQ